ncbi:unnamed protein product [Mytilus coruscus]|uniref:Uncharacterized protein n=1 Tax=Mytilus coruscus TaxID=42192 RepID=A0A6J8EXG2_MYTCO|nr:unnamed protein product [Mytilus coruscus]
MTWILLNLPLDQIPINEVLITCCQQSKIHHVKYIFHEVDNAQLDIKGAFVQACRVVPKDIILFHKLKEVELNHLMIVDYLFKMKDDKESYLSLVVNEIFEKKKSDIILYFLQAGYCMNTHMKNILIEACRYGQVQLVQWILGNVEHKDLDIKSAFLEACNGMIYVGRKKPFLKNHFDTNKLVCVAIMWHFIQDVHFFEIDTILKTITKTKLCMSSSDSDVYYIDSDTESSSEVDLETWLLYIQNINQTMKCKFDSSVSITEENKN